MEKIFKIINEDGVHARPATALVNAAKNFKSELFAEANGKQVTLKSILGVLSFGLERGDMIKFIAKGEDEAEAIAALEEVIVSQGVGEVHA